MPFVDVWCPTCFHLGSRWLPAGGSIESLYCEGCGDGVKSPRHRDARRKLSEAIFNRNVMIVRAVAAGDGEIQSAYEYAKYAAHTAFKLKLVPYGPEPTRK